jgi:hypothetical protein
LDSKTFRLLTLVVITALAAPAQAAPSGGAIRYIYVVPLSHLDIGFNHSVPEVIALQKTYLDDAMDYAEQFPAYHWTIESVWQLDQWLAQTTDPAEVTRLRGLLEQGRIELMAGYANTHQGLLGREELNRFLYPARRYETRWGLDLDTAISDDVPGSSAALPQVLRANGVRNLVAGINTTFGGKPAIPVSDYLFNWQGVDGSRVLTWVSVFSYAEGIFKYTFSSSYENMAAHTQALVDAYQNNGYAYDSIIALMGFDNDRPDKILGNGLANIERWNAEHVSPQIVVATPRAFFDHVRETYGDDAFTTYTGDWSGLWENDARTPVSIAQNRVTKAALPQAETLAAIELGFDATAPYPAATFDGAWRNLLVDDEHSGAGGGFELSAAQIDTNNRWFRQRTVNAYNATQRAQRDGLKSIARRIRTTRPSVVVYNPLSFVRSDLATLPRTLTPPGPWQLVDLASGAPVAVQAQADGSHLFVARDVPAVGYRLYAVVRTGNPPSRPRTIAADEIESAAYRVRVDSLTGEITSLYDKVAERELVDGAAGTGFNRLVRADQDDAFVWGVWSDVPSGTVSVVAESGPVASRLVVTRSQSALRETVITLPSGLARVEVRNTLERDRTDYADHVVLTWWYDVTFPFALGEDFIARFQSPNGWLAPQTDWIAGTAHNTRIPSHGADLRATDGYGVTVANRETQVARLASLPFWDAGEPDRPLLFHTLYARSDEAETTDQGWLPFDTWEPGAPDRYVHNVAITSAGGGFDAVAGSQFADAYSSPLLVTSIPAQPDGVLPGPTGSLISISQAGVVLTTLKRAEFQNPTGTDLILRLQEIAGTAANDVIVTLPFALAFAEINGMGEQRQGATPVPVNPLLVSLAPWQTLTLRVRPIH